MCPKLSNWTSSLITRQKRSNFEKGNLFFLFIFFTKKKEENVWLCHDYIVYTAFEFIFSFKVRIAFCVFFHSLMNTLLFFVFIFLFSARLSFLSSSSKTLSTRETNYFKYVNFVFRNVSVRVFACKKEALNL